MPLFIFGARAWWQHHSGRKCGQAKCCRSCSNFVGSERKRLSDWFFLLRTFFCISFQAVGILKEVQKVHFPAPGCFVCLNIMTKSDTKITKFQLSQSQICLESGRTEALNDFGAFAESLMASYSRQTLAARPNAQWLALSLGNIGETCHGLNTTPGSSDSPCSV